MAPTDYSERRSIVDETGAFFEREGYDESVRLYFNRAGGLTIHMVSTESDSGYNHKVEQHYFLEPQEMEQLKEWLAADGPADSLRSQQEFERDVASEVTCWMQQNWSLLQDGGYPGLAELSRAIRHRAMMGAVDGQPRNRLVSQNESQQ